MGKNESRDQKRKAKLKKRAERSRKTTSLAYTGAKYKTDEYAPVFAQTEIGMYEAYVMSDRELTDDDIEGAVEQLVTRMRAGPLPPIADPNRLTVAEGEDEELVIASIRRNWQILAQKGTLPGRDDLIGVLRTILNSISIWRSPSPLSRGYLRYIEGFMKKLGVSVQRTTADLEPLPEPAADPLLVIGRAWVADGDQAAAAAFADQVESVLRTGGAERVINVCQQLLGETEDMAVVPALQALALRGHRAMKTEMG